MQILETASTATQQKINIYNWIYIINLEKQSKIKLKFKGYMYMYVCTLGCCPLASSLKHSGYLLQNGQ